MNNNQTVAEDAVVNGVILTGRDKKKYEREMFLKMMMQEKNSDLVNAEYERVIKTLELRLNFHGAN